MPNKLEKHKYRELVTKMLEEGISLVAQAVKNLPANAGDARSIPAPGNSPGEGNGNHSRILAWEIPWTEEPGRLQSKRLQRVGHH